MFICGVTALACGVIWIVLGTPIDQTLMATGLVFVAFMALREGRG